MALQVDDPIEVNINAVWRPAVVGDLYTLKGTDYLLARFPGTSMIYQEIMVINEYTVWRYPDAPVSA